MLCVKLSGAPSGLAWPLPARAALTLASVSVLTPGRGGRDIVPKYNSLNPIVRPTQLSWQPVNAYYVVGLVLVRMFSWFLSNDNQMSRKIVAHLVQLFYPIFFLAF